MSPPVRVLMVVPYYPYPVVGGLERQSHELAKSLVELGIGVQALSYRFDRSQPAREVVEGIPVYRIPWSPKKFVRFIRNPFDLLRALYSLRHSYDIVHFHQYSWISTFAIVAVRLFRKPVLLKLSTVGSRSLPGIAASRFGALRLAVFKKADAVVAMTKDSLSELNAIGYPKQRVLTTPNGIRMRSNATGSSKRRSSRSPCRVVFVGRLNPEKNIHDLLHAWKRVVDSASSAVELELWGRGPDEAELKDLAMSLGIADSVLFRGYVTEVRDKLEDMDVFVLTSNREGNSNAVLEAMAAGLPVVSTRVGGTPMQVGAEGARWLITPGDRDALYACLLELVDDASLRQRLGDAMRERILAHFEIKHVAGTYAAAYRLLADGRRDEVNGVGDPVVVA